MGLALGFALSLVCLVSLALLVTFPKEALKLSVERSNERTFKGKELSSLVSVGSRASSTLTKFDLLSVPDGVEATIAGTGAQRTLSVRSKYAGVYSGIKVRVGILDPLGMFERNEVHEIKLAFEFLPISLLARREPLRVAAAMLGDYPAGRRGFGQEFYSAEVYSSTSSSRDIMWKRQARTPSDYLLVRVGEANIPETVTVCLIERKDITKRRSPAWMDLASEALARVGLPVVSSGVRVRLLHVLGDRTTVREAKDDRELSDVLVELWRDDSPKELSDEKAEEADIIVAAQAETEDPSMLNLVLRKPSVLLGWDRRQAVSGSGIAFFSGHEDVSWLVAKVLSR
jgi:hypothetical protein